MKLPDNFKLNYFNDKSMLFYFMRYMKRRQDVFFNRYLHKHDKPWSKDWILQKYKFTNVFKPLDRGTRWLLENIIHNPKIKTEEELLWNIFIYKWFNNVQTAESLKLPIDIVNFDYREFYNRLMEITDHGIFTTAHMVCGSNVSRTDWGKGPGSKPKTYTWAINELRSNIDRMMSVVKGAGSLENLHKLLKNNNLVGDFLAYELVIDINYSHLIDYCENSWANPGPGCMNGINWTFSNIKDENGNWLQQRGADWGPEYKSTITNLRPKKQYIELMRWVQDNVWQLFAKFGLDDFQPLSGVDFNMQVIEFNFCEFSKYARAMLGCGAPRNKFTELHSVTNLPDLCYEAHFEGSYECYPVRSQDKIDFGKRFGKIGSRTIERWRAKDYEYDEFFTD